MKPILKKDTPGYNPKKDYCTMFPDKAFGVNYNYGCYLHDRHYRNERKVRLSRKGADKLMRKIIYDKFKKDNKRIIGFLWSNLMYIGVRLFAKRAWE